MTGARKLGNAELGGGKTLFTLLKYRKDLTYLEKCSTMGTTTPQSAELGFHELGGELGGGRHVVLARERCVCV